MGGSNNTSPGQAPGNPSCDTALAYLRAGLSVIPIRPDGSKRPALSQWERFQRQLPPENMVRCWWEDGTKGIAIIGGAVSGGLECLDFDQHELFAPWCELVEAQAPGLIAKYSCAKEGCENHAACASGSVDTGSAVWHLAMIFATDFVLQLNGWAT